jgi:hypothetical protein
MVNELVLIRERWRVLRKLLRRGMLLMLFLLLFLIVFASGFLTNINQSPMAQIIIENPLKNIVYMHTNEEGEVNKTAVIEQAVVEFNADYINYILAALKVGKLHKSLLGEKPLIEFVLDQEHWNSEIDGGRMYTKKGEIEKEDLRIIISKEEAVEAILSSDVTAFMSDSVRGGRTEIQMIAGKAELLNKGYFSIYEEITGKEFEG